MAQKSSPEVRVVASNRKAYHDYTIEDTIEAGIVLIGSEIKSIRAGRANLRDGYAVIENGEVWMHNVHIAPYDPASRYGHEPRRKRKLLLHKREIARLARQVQEKGYTLVPVRLYLRGNLAKVELALARGKRQYDKRAAIAERDSRRRAERAIREREQERER
ncbi:MAG TPA: SsrA-binding protein SmpB [Anaerolineae bacterium]|nr:SsrA-binding protein SmpB [Anaerolineae bacterium]